MKHKEQLINLTKRYQTLENATAKVYKRLVNTEKNITNLRSTWGNKEEPKRSTSS